MLGALNAVTHQLTTVCNDGYINAATVCDLLRRLKQQYPGRPLTLFLDNARYQRCKLFQALAEELNIELQYLPSYSPNLNLIERYWKFVKKKCLYSKHYPDYASFREAILNCIQRSHRKHKTEQRSLLAFNFQPFQETQFVTVWRICNADWPIGESGCSRQLRCFHPLPNFVDGRDQGLTVLSCG